MNYNLETTNRQFEDIYEQLKAVYEKLSKERGEIKEYVNGNSMWGQILPAVLLMKNIELINSQMQDLLNLTHSLGKVEENNDTAANSYEDNTIPSVEENGDSNSEDKLSALALDIIKLRDQIFIAKYNCSDKQKKVLLSIYEELGRILKINGIEPLEEGNIFNSQYHTVIETKTTDKIQLNNTIAAIYRPGYRIKSKVLRTQEVVLYKYESVDDDTP